MHLPYPIDVTYKVTCHECGKTETNSSPVYAGRGFPIPGFPGWSTVLNDNGSQIYCPEHTLFIRNVDSRFSSYRFKEITE